MTANPIRPPEAASDTSFFSDLMDNIMTGAMIPKVQIERVVGPLLGYFLADVLSQKLGSEIKMLCPEFPIMKRTLDPKNETNQSTNIDWLMFDSKFNRLLLVELKTTDTTFSKGQADVYKTIQDMIRKYSGTLLVDGLPKGNQSLERGKYEKVREILREKLLPDFSKRFADCKDAQVIYIGPKVSKRKFEELKENKKLPHDWEWFSFKELSGTIAHQHSQQWLVLINHLLPLDNLSRSKRNNPTT